MSIVSDDEDAQKFGFCRVAYAPTDGDDGSDDPGGPSPPTSNGSSLFQILTSLKAGRELLDALPIRIASYHFCHEKYIANIILNAVRFVFGKNMRLRMKSHYGEFVVCVCVCVCLCLCLCGGGGALSWRTRVSIHHPNYRRRGCLLLRRFNDGDAMVDEMFWRPLR